MTKGEFVKALKGNLRWTGAVRFRERGTTEGRAARYTMPAARYDRRAFGAACGRAVWPPGQSARGCSGGVV